MGLTALVTDVATALVATTTTPSTPPSPGGGPDPNSVSPGVLGFLAVFVLAIATWLLLRNMTGHLRRLNYREEQRRAAEAHQQAEQSQQQTGQSQQVQSPPDDGSLPPRAGSG